MTIRKTQIITIDGTSRYTAALRVGSKYLVTCNADCWIRQQADDSTALVAAATNSIPMVKGQAFDLEPVTGLLYISVIQDGTAPATARLCVAEQE